MEEFQQIDGSYIEDDVKSYLQGNLGIGISSPTAKLHVGGSVISTTGMGICTSSITTSALLHVQADVLNPKGVLLPVLTSTQKINIASPVGLTVYDSDLKQLDSYNSSGWDKKTTCVKLLVNSSSGSPLTSISSTVLYLPWNSTPIFSSNWANPVNVGSNLKINFPFVGYYSCSITVCFQSGISAAQAANQGYELFNSSNVVIEGYNYQSGSGSSDSVRNTASFLIYISDITNYLRLNVYQNSGSNKTMGYTGYELSNIAIYKV